jgi:hypothetical protein
MRHINLVLFSLLLVCVVRPIASAGEENALRNGKPDQLGEVSFPVSCNAAAQQEFNRAMALFHSFWFDPAKAAFGKVLQYAYSTPFGHPFHADSAT